MTHAEFSEKLRLVLKLLSLTGGKLASELGIDKSVVSRWTSGGAQPSAHNLSALSALIAARAPGFRTLDWDRDLDNFAALFGIDAADIAAIRPTARPGLAPSGLPLANMEQLLSATAARGKPFEGFFRSTRPHPIIAGRYVHEFGMIRREELGLLRLRMGSANTVVEGWMLPIHGSLCSIAVDLNSGTLLFGIFHAVGAARLDVFDGLTLIPGADMGRSPTATAMICERVGDLTGDIESDDRHLKDLMSQNPVAPEGSVPAAMQAHLARDFGPTAVGAGGEWLLSLPLARSMARGPDYWAQGG